LTYPTKINKLTLLFNPKTVDLSEFDAKVGKSDIQMQGKIENFLQYALQDSLLKGAFSFKSKLLDLNELMGPSDTTTSQTSTADSSATMSVVEVPSNLDVKLVASIGKLLYDNMTITNVSGGVGIKDSKMSLDKLKLTIDELEGTMQLSGVYNTQNIKKPTVDFDVDVANFDIPKTFKMFNSVQKLAPIAQYAKGKVSTNLTFTTLLDQTMSPVMNSLIGKGALKTSSVTIEGFAAIDKLADALNQPKYKKMAFENVNANYEFKDGRVEVKEMPIKSGNITGKVKGSTGFDQTIYYIWNLEIPRSEFGSQANAVAGSLLAQLNQQAGTDIKLGDKVKIKALFSGTVTNPILKTDLFNTETTVKDQVQNLVNQGVDMAKEKAREEAEKIMKDAQAEADKLKAEAAALAEKTKAEGYAAIDKNIESIGNPLQKAAAKAAAPAAKKEVDKQAQKILDEANKKADQVLINAKVEADKKLQ
ncbi:MAG: AsmA-like C-terminal region-containing protein, partial [Bacteroidia bacterium]|nr:AsmA-like C-terminal region-containing protein [Bacteroidia bacterium]